MYSKLVRRSFYNQKKVKNIVPWTYVITDLNDEEIIGTFYEKGLKKLNQEELGDSGKINRSLSILE